MDNADLQPRAEDANRWSVGRILLGAGRCFRVVLVVAPLIAGGLYLGLGMGASIAPDLRTGAHRAPRLSGDISMEVLGGEGEVRKSEAAPLRVAPLQGEGLRLGGGPHAEVEMRMSRRAVAAIVARYDRAFSEKGWHLDEQSTNIIGEQAPPADGVGRVYTKDGVYRLLLVGEELDASGARPVTLFEGAFGVR